MYFFYVEFQLMWMWSFNALNGLKSIRVPTQILMKNYFKEYLFQST